jgi:hypothetical protein
MLDRQTEQPGPHYVPYLLMSYNRVYELYSTDEEMFATPYDETVVPLFDGTHDAAAINAQMPAIPVEAVADPVVQGLSSDAEHPLLRALRDNDVRGDHPDYQWNHRAPIRLYHCSGDQNVPFRNSEVALATLQAKGAAVELIEPEGARGGSHADCVIPSVIAALGWFETFLTPMRASQ